MIRWITNTAAAVTLLSASVALATVTNERDYQLGDDGAEDASVGITVGTGASNVTPDSTLDSSGPTGAFIDIVVNGDPQYVSVSTRPGAGGGDLGADFDGVDDYLLTGFALNRPTDFWNDITLFSGQDYPKNYDTILSHGIQLWAKPDAAGLGQGNRQQLIIDSTDGGGVYISDQDFWGLTYDDDANDQFVSSVAVDTSGDGWTHLMQLGGVADLTGGKSAAIGVLLVDGVAVSATNDVYDSSLGEPLVIGSNLAGDGEFYDGQLDDVRIFLWGDNSTVAAGPNGQVGEDYGSLNLSTDNDWIAQELATLGVTDAADVNLDGSVSGDGTGLASVDDVTKFVENWRSVRTVDDIQVGDWISRQNGDLNYDGITNLLDWAIVNAANPSMGASILSALGGSQVPEPSSLLLAGFAGIAIALVAKRR